MMEKERGERGTVSTSNVTETRKLPLSLFLLEKGKIVALLTAIHTGRTDPWPRRGTTTGRNNSPLEPSFETVVSLSLAISISARLG